MASNGKGILKDKKIDVEGCIPRTEDLVKQESYRESGDVFDSLIWRQVFITLISIKETHPYLLNFLNILFLRGKSYKQKFSGNSIIYKVPLPEEQLIPQGARKILGNGSSYSITVNYPKGNSIVSSCALTPERTKCVFRSFAVPVFMDEKSTTAIAESIGYGSLIRSFELYAIDIKKPDTEEKSADYDTWNKLHMSARDQPWINYLSHQAIYAGCVSSKEVYMEDENQFPGCIWWSGVHAMMVDLSNKLKAPKMSADSRAKFENSNFYADFKKKQIARNILLTSSDAYMTFLNGIRPLIVKYVNCSTVLTEEENSFTDILYKEALDSSRKSAASVVSYTEQQLKEIPGAPRFNISSSSPIEDVTRTSQKHLKEVLSKLKFDEASTSSGEKSSA